MNEERTVKLTFASFQELGATSVNHWELDAGFTGFVGREKYVIESYFSFFPFLNIIQAYPTCYPHKEMLVK